MAFIAGLLVEISDVQKSEASPAFAIAVLQIRARRVVRNTSDMTPIADALLKISSSLVLTGLFVLLLLSMEVGYRVGRRLRKMEISERASALVQQGLLTFLSLLLAFGIALADNRFEERRTILIDEANAISTTYLRMSFADGETQDSLKSLMLKYIDTRIASYQCIPDDPKCELLLDETAIAQRQIWSRAVEFGKQKTTVLASLLLGSLNETFDLQAKQDFVYRYRVPRTILALPLLVSCLVAGLLGFTQGHANRRHILSSFLMLTVLSFSLFVVLDLDRPHLGYIQIKPQILIELKTRLSRS